MERRRKAQILSTVRVLNLFTSDKAGFMDQGQNLAHGVAKSLLEPLALEFLRSSSPLVPGSGKGLLLHCADEQKHVIW